VTLKQATLVGCPGNNTADTLLKTEIIDRGLRLGHTVRQVQAEMLQAAYEGYEGKGGTGVRKCRTSSRIKWAVTEVAADCRRRL